MSTEGNIRWRALGSGSISTPDSIKDRKLSARIGDYKNRVAGRYRSASPQDILSSIPNVRHFSSTKIDGETWFLHHQNGTSRLLSPSGKIIKDIPITHEAEKRLNGSSLLFAGELYARTANQRTRVHDLHAALGGGENADVNCLRFAAFDVLEADGLDYQKRSFEDRTHKITGCLYGSSHCHPVDFASVSSAQQVMQCYEDTVIQNRQEGIVVRCGDGQIIKIKPEITIDAAVVGYTERRDGSISELLLALMRDDSHFQILGRIDTGFTRADRHELSRMLQPLAVSSSFMAASRSGALFRFVRPQIIIEVKCNDIIGTRSNGRPIKRMALTFGENNWEAVRPLPAASLIHAVFRRIRYDKSLSPQAVRFSQITDLVPIASGNVNPVQLPPSTVVRREVFTKASGAKTQVRKVLVWKTNKEDVDSLYPSFVIFFTDFNPCRKNPLKTDVRVASCLEKANAIADAWLAEQTKNWKKEGGVLSATSLLPSTCHANQKFKLDLVMGFGRTSSINFNVAVRRFKALAKVGKLDIEKDDKGRPSYYCLAFDQKNLVENIRKIENCYNIIRRWKSSEFLVNGDPLGVHDAQSVINTISDISACWRRQKRTGEHNGKTCLKQYAVGCSQLYFKPSTGFPGLALEHPAWYAVGSFDGEVVTLDKDVLLDQLNKESNELLCLCPFFERVQIVQRIKNLPEKLDPKSKSGRWIVGYSTNDQKPAWVFPRSIKNLPFDVSLTKDSCKPYKSTRSAFSWSSSQNTTNNLARSNDPEKQSNIPSARYSDVCGQVEAVEAVRDYAELPLKYPELFQKMGIRPGRGILLWGPPGNGKSLLARAVAGESDSHIEIISGPEILSKWVGESEGALREAFQRAQRFAPSILLMDELDSIAPIRDSVSGGNMHSIVSQLLVLMDGITERGRILIIATTNRPDRIDPAILRPGRIDRKIYVGPPARDGRKSLLRKLMSRMSLANDIDVDYLAPATDGFSGAQIEHLVHQAGLLAIKESLSERTIPTDLLVCHRHFLSCFSN